MAGRRQKRRKRRGYVRPSRAKPKVGWSLRELAALSGTTARNIRAYLLRKIIPRARFLGSATRYDRRQLLWLVALRRLRETERLPLTTARARLDALSPAELEALATQGIAPGQLAAALGLQPVASQSAITPPPPPFDSPTQVSRALPRWSRVELALGLELHVRDDASPQTLELAREVQAFCLTRAEART